MIALSDINLSKIDLSGIDLRGIKLNKRNVNMVFIPLLQKAVMILILLHLIKHGQ